MGVGARETAGANANGEPAGTTEGSQGTHKETHMSDDWPSRDGDKRDRPSLSSYHFSKHPDSPAYTTEWILGELRYANLKFYGNALRELERRGVDWKKELGYD